MEVCETDMISFQEESIKVPTKLKQLQIAKDAKTKKIIIPQNSTIENIEMNNEGVQIIMLPDGKYIKIGKRENIKKFRQKNDKYVVIIREKDIKGYRYEFLDKKTLEAVKSGKICIGTSNPMEKPIFQYENIFQVNLEDLENSDCISLESDENGDYFWGKYGTEEGKIYTKPEALQIREKLYKVIDKINVPPKGVKDREKIIYAQIVQNLYNELIYDTEGSNLIDKYKQGEIDSEDEESLKRVDSTQNLRGLLDGKTVCRGFAGIIKALAEYFDLNCKVITNNDHAWNLITLDGEKYEDDFTWYRNELATSNLSSINTFLKGIDSNGNRSFDGLTDHEIGIALELSRDLSRTERINLLGTDWSKINEWESVDIRKTTKMDSIRNQFQSFAESKKTLLIVALSDLKGKMICSDKSFLSRINKLFGDRSKGK